MAVTYTVVAPACSVFLKSGAVTLLYKGGVLPSSSELRDGEAKRLEEGGFVVKGDEPAAQPDEKPEPVMGEGDDPADFTVPQVEAHLASASEEEKARVLEAETAGKNRKALTGQ